MWHRFPGTGKPRIPSPPDHFLILMKQPTQYLKVILILSFDVCGDFLSIFPPRVSDETFLCICYLTHACFFVQPITSSLILSYLIIIMAKNTNFGTFYGTVSTYLWFYPCMLHCPAHHVIFDFFIPNINVEKYKFFKFLQYSFPHPRVCVWCVCVYVVWCVCVVCVCVVWVCVVCVWCVVCVYVVL